jgi:hypothetical protein
MSCDHDLTQHEGVIDNTPKAVGSENDDRPGLILENKEHDALKENQCKHLELERGVNAKELLDLRILFWMENGS